jgi:hypothetical protein
MLGGSSAILDTVVMENIPGEPAQTLTIQSKANESTSALKSTDYKRSVINKNFLEGLMKPTFLHMFQSVRQYSSIPIIRPLVFRLSVLLEVPCRNAPFYQQSTEHVAE